MQLRHLIVCCLLPLQLLAQQETVAVLEEFDHDPSRFPSINHGDTAIAGMKDGHYVMDSKNANRFWALRLGAITTAFICNQLEMKMKLTTDDNSFGYGMIWNTEQKAMNIFDEYRFLVSKNGYFSVIQRQGGNDIVQKKWTACDCIQINDYNVLRVHQNTDSTHRFYINDKLVFEKKLPLTNLAKFGFYSSEHAILYIDRLKISLKY